MMPKLKKLPIGIQAFETMREQGYLYVDKTADIYRLVDEGMFYFLARPRRFGKSLLVSILKCLFQGRKELFQGLWIHQQVDWEWKKHPVVLIDFNGISHDNPENMKLSLGRNLFKIARTYDVTLEEPLLTDQFKELILALYQKTGMPVVILVDEYDKPIIDHLGKGDAVLEIAKANRDILKSFFGVLKEGTVSPLLRFVFLTGISKFSKVSIFSELNNLNDISMNEQYATMLGYTYDELKNHFLEYTEKFAKKVACSQDSIMKKLAEHYNGYRFSENEVKVYNPFSILKAFAEMKFKNYWFETGTPTFLVNLLQKREYDLTKIEKIQVTESLFSTYDIDNLKPEALLFQTGYVTIKDIQENIYTLGYPNQEVKTAFSEILLLSYIRGIDDTTGSQFIFLSKYLKQEDFDSFFETITAIFASIPYTLNTKRDEAYFHTMFYLMVSASGTNARSEILTSRGRIDLEVEQSDKVYIIEFKCNQSSDVAIKQIQEKGYSEKFKSSDKKLILMGINFNTELRNVEDWKIV